MRLALLLPLLAVASHSFSQTARTVLVETAESVWAPTSSDVICAKEAIRDEFGSSVVFISHHWDDFQNGGDPLFKQFENEWAQTFNISSFNRGLVDRVAYDGSSLTSLGLSLWSDTIAARLNRPAEAQLTLPEVLIDPATDEIFVRAQLKFSESSIENRELRFFCYLVQDGVISDQLVATSSLGNCTLFNDTADTTFDFMHNDVPVLNPSTYEGTDNILPQQVNAGAVYSDMYTFQLPTGASLDDLRVVAFAGEYDNGNGANNEVINAAASSTFTSYDSSDESDPNHPENRENENSRHHSSNWSVGIVNPSVDAHLTVSPNPASDFAVVDFSLPSAQPVQISVWDASGALVMSKQNSFGSGPQRVALDLSSLNQGVYRIALEGANASASAQAVVIR